MNRETQAQDWTFVRKMMTAPSTDAYLSADRLHLEVRRLKTRLARVQARGGSYRDVDMSDDVGSLLARLEAGATLSTYVH